MIKMSLSELASILGGEPSTENINFHGVSTDTRTLLPGNLFVAIRGEQYDGHDFIKQAEKKGASAILISRKIESTIPQILVNNTLTALGKLSSIWRDRFSIPLIGVTGSNGKTTLKNMIAAILLASCNNNKNEVFATEGNLNNEIGLPLTLLRLEKQHRFGVIEMGMNHFGEIAYLTQLAKPAIAVITNAAESHLEGLQSVAGVAQAKGEIFRGLNKTGVAILNRDDHFFNYWRDLIEDRKYLTFGLKNPADITAIISDNKYITLQTPIGNIDVILSLLGTHNIMNALAATAAALALSIDLSAIKQGLENVSPAPGRMRQYLLPDGVRIIDDTYNANPFSLQAAINTLATFAGTKVLVLGDMKELGPNEKQIHFDVGQKIREAKIDYLFTLGNLSAATSQAFGANASHFTQREELLVALKPYLKKDVNLLVKGSRSMKMEKIISNIIPEDQIEHAH